MAHGAAGHSKKQGMNCLRRIASTFTELSMTPQMHQPGFYCHHRAACVRRSPLQEMIPFTCESYLVHPQRYTCAAQGDQKTPSLRAGRERIPSLYTLPT